MFHAILMFYSILMFHAILMFYSILMFHAILIQGIHDQFAVLSEWIFIVESQYISKYRKSKWQ